MKCKKCGNEVKHEGTMSTMVGGHPFWECPLKNQHDDNCITRYYRCDCGNKWIESKRTVCECGWKQEDECFCHEGKKVDEWSDPADYLTDNMLKFLGRKHEKSDGT